MKYIDYSVVIPIFNESEIIPELWRRLSDILDKLDSSSEVIFINDGSIDVQVSDRKLIINEKVNIIDKDLEIKNGYIHLINNVILPKDLKITS